MKFISKDTIQLDRELSDLDKFVIDFVKIISKHTKYVLVSGYVSILLGRARMSEDVDIIVPKMDETAVRKLLEDLNKNDFYCLNTEKEIYSYLIDKLGVRFAKKGVVIPNMEFKFAKSKIDEIALSKPIKVKLKNEELILSNLELQIAFKEQILKSPKDMEDALHLRKIAEKYLDESLLKKYEVMLNEFY
ncbi:MAG: hypothetical protein EPN86_02715 [Nanoarchaeota archaeon]|nr:MAG: hypothetical protein EPN86_02715 [Nanoarchaeota archaeon]